MPDAWMIRHTSFRGYAFICICGIRRNGRFSRRPTVFTHLLGREFIFWIVVQHVKHSDTVFTQFTDQCFKQLQAASSRDVLKDDVRMHQIERSVCDRERVVTLRKANVR